MAGCVHFGWQVTLCDPVWQVTPHSSETDSHKELYSALTFNLLTAKYDTHTHTHVRTEPTNAKARAFDYVGVSKYDHFVNKTKFWHCNSARQQPDITAGRHYAITSPSRISAINSLQITPEYIRCVAMLSVLAALFLAACGPKYTELSLPVRKCQ